MGQLTVRRGVFYAGRLAVIKGVDCEFERFGVGGDEKGSLKSETVKYGRELQGTPTRE
jgi:hypothetical protein